MTASLLLEKIEEEKKAGKTAVIWLSRETQVAIEDQVPALIIAQGLQAIKTYLEALLPK